MDHSAGDDESAVIYTLVKAHPELSDFPDREHAIRCAQFATILFDHLSESLGLAADDRRLAIAAALWHDAGYQRGQRDHPRKSYDIISEATIPEFSSSDKQVIACAARYHRSPLPSIEHAGFGYMSSIDQRRVRRLAAIVRIAVALDAGHLGVVRDLSVRVSDGAVMLGVGATSNAEVERDRLIENGSAFTRLTGLAFDFNIDSTTVVG